MFNYILPAMLGIENQCCCDRKSRTACAQSFAPWQQATIKIMRCNLSYYCLLAPCTLFCFFAHIPFVVNHTINATPPERLQQHPSILQRTTLIARSLCKDRTRHNLHILVTAPFCCDRKSRAKCAQSFVLW